MGEMDAITSAGTVTRRTFSGSPSGKATPAAAMTPLHGHAVLHRLAHQLGAVAQKHPGLPPERRRIQPADLFQQRIAPAGNALCHNGAPPLSEYSL